MRQRRGGNNNASGGTNINPVNNNNNENEENNNNEISRNNEAWEVLTDAEFFFVKQRVDWAESFTGIEKPINILYLMNKIRSNLKSLKIKVVLNALQGNA